MTPRVVRWAGAAVLLGGLIACNETGPAFRRVGVRIVPDQVTLDAVGDTVTLVAEVTESNGDPFFGARVDWSSSDASVAEVASDGLVVARGPGGATITAVVSGLGILGVQGTARIEVQPSGTAVNLADPTVVPSHDAPPPGPGIPTPDPPDAPGRSGTPFPTERRSP